MIQIKTSIFIFIVGLFLFTSCKKNQETKEEDEQQEQSFANIQAKDMESAVIYEANIRQYSEKGDFASFTKDIPELKKLGVKIIWLMPIHPISQKNRKATGDLMVEQIEDEEERKKYLGSYYAVADYKGINPEFGTEDDLKNLIKTAHENQMWVILDWVANHTGWDHVWIEKHPEFYTKDKDGNISEPLKEDGSGESIGWDDTADLDYTNKDLWQEMTNDMRYWLTEFNVDGFRCDVAGMVPTEFWNFATKKLRAEKDIFMLAESEDKDLFFEAFDMGYNWEGHAIMNEIAEGIADVSKWDEYMLKVDSAYQKDDILMNFVTNHDENSWNGTIYERMPNSWQAFTALSYALPGMPLIYSGMEYDMNQRLKFFEKDQIPKTKGKMWPLLEKLGKIKNENADLNGGKQASNYVRIPTSNDEVILAFRRGKSFAFVANLSNQEQSFTIKEGAKALDLLSGEEIEFEADKAINFKPWQFHLLQIQS